jgi:hypothetical protein
VLSWRQRVAADGDVPAAPAGSGRIYADQIESNWPASKATSQRATIRPCAAS